MYECFVADKEKDWEALNEAQTAVLSCLREVLTGAYTDCVSSVALSGNISYFIQEMNSFVESKRQKAVLNNLRIQIEEFIHSFILLKKEQDFVDFQRKTWLSPLFARALMETVKDEKQFFYRAVVELRNIGVLSAYVYLLKEPVYHDNTSIWMCPDEIYLAAYSENGIIEAYDPDERPTATRNRGITTYMNPANEHKLVAFTLSAEQLQYGFLLCEFEDNNLPALYLLSLQLATAIRFLNLSKAERIAQEELQISLQMIEEKNEVLNFISSYDELTGLLNRRGFMEKALTMNRTCVGKNAFFVFCDLDHLKEINDFYGHAEGDFAIMKIGTYLREILGEQALIGRIGGDENVAFVLEEYLPDNLKNIRNDNVDTMGKIIQKAMKIVNKKYNDLCEKPYYIECSVGVQEFICSRECDITKLLSQADSSLYEQKKLRRDSIRRS